MLLSLFACGRSKKNESLSISRLKGAKITVESHVKPGKGDSSFWEQMAENRANLIRDHLAAKASKTF